MRAQFLVEFGKGKFQRKLKLAYYMPLKIFCVSPSKILKFIIDE